MSEYFEENGVRWYVGSQPSSDPEREARFQAEMAEIRAGWTQEQARALGRRLARYRRNRQAAEAAYYAERG